MPKGGKFISISSGAGTINKEMKSGSGTYGLTKVRHKLFLKAQLTLDRQQSTTLCASCACSQIFSTDSDRTASSTLRTPTFSSRPCTPVGLPREFIYLEKTDDSDMGSAGAKWHGLEAPPDDIKKTIRMSSSVPFTRRVALMCSGNGQAYRRRRQGENWRVDHCLVSSALVLNGMC